MAQLGTRSASPPPPHRMGLLRKWDFPSSVKCHFRRRLLLPAGLPWAAVPAPQGRGRAPDGAQGSRLGAFTPFPVPPGAAGGAAASGEVRRRRSGSPPAAAGGPRRGVAAAPARTAPAPPRRGPRRRPPPRSAPTSRAGPGHGARLRLRAAAGPQRGTAPPAMEEEDPELERKAVEELLKEAKRGRTRAETMGAMGWLKCPLAGANKRFLINTIKNTLPSQKEQDQEREQKEVSKEPEPNKSRKEEKPKKRRIHPYTPSFQSRRRVSYSPPRHRNRNQHTKDKYEKRSSKR